MSPATTYGLITFLVGVILLLGWLYANAANPRGGAILRKSVLLVALPIIFVPGAWILHHVGMWAAVTCEEGVKAFASTRERSRVDRFWLVTLFGIWELTLDKPFWGVRLAQTISNWDRLQISALVFATALPVLMHTVTAAIYAFVFETRLWAAFIASWIVHATFNWAVGYFGLSASSAIVESMILTIALAAILLGQARQQTVNDLSRRPLPTEGPDRIAD